MEPEGGIAGGVHHWFGRGQDIVFSPMLHPVRGEVSNRQLASPVCGEVPKRQLASPVRGEVSNHNGDSGARLF